MIGRRTLFRGAYSYVPINSLSARAGLSKPVDGTLFFAGEPTVPAGNATAVHGAIAVRNQSGGSHTTVDLKFWKQQGG